MLTDGRDRDERALLEACEAFRRDCEAYGGADKVGMALGKSGDTIRHWWNPWHKAKPTFPDLVRFCLRTGGANLLATFLKVTFESLQTQVIDSRAAQREIEYLKKLVGR